MVKALIFDFDGVVAETEPYWFDSLYEFALSRKLSTDYETMSQFVGDGDTKMMEHLAGLLGSREALDGSMGEIRKNFYDKTKGLPVRPGILEYIHQAKSMGLKTAIASNSGREYLDYWLERLDLTNVFDAVISRELVNDVKPSPDPYLRTLEALDISHQEAIAFEDSVIGLRSAAAADICAVALPTRVSLANVCRYGALVIDAQQTPLEELFRKLRQLGQIDEKRCVI